MPLPLAAATAHLGIYSIVLVLGFAIGIFGHLSRSRTLIFTGIIVIAATTAYFLVLGENAANCHGSCV